MSRGGRRTRRTVNSQFLMELINERAMTTEPFEGGEMLELPETAANDSPAQLTLTAAAELEEATITRGGRAE